MSALIVSDVLTRVQRQLGDASQAQFTQADVIRWVNDAQREFSQANDILQAMASAATVANQSAYALPANVQRFKKVLYQGGTLQGVSIEEADQLIPQNGQTTAQGFPVGTPIYYWVYAGVINLWPAPQTAGATDLTLYYTRKPVDVVNPGDSIDLPDEYMNAVVKYCITQAYELDTNYYAAELKYQTLNQDLANLKGQVNWPEQDVYPSITALSEYDYPGLGAY